MAPNRDGPREVGRPGGESAWSKLRDFGRRLNRALRHAVAGICTALVPVFPSGPLPEDEKVKRVLVVRANFRMGNVVLATSLLDPLHRRFSHAQIDWLVGDAGARLLDGLPVARVYRISRDFIWQPWRFLGLIRELRRARYDVAVDGAMTSFSGAFYAWLSGAPHRVGGHGKSAVWLTSRLAVPPVANVYAATPAMAVALGVSSDGWPRYAVSAGEVRAAEGLRRALRPEWGDQTSLIGVFVGGHREKRWPLALWSAVLHGLAEAGERVVVFVGPEEVDALPELARGDDRSVLVIPPQPLRLFAALVAGTRILVTPDSGPMHLAAALHVPVVAILQKDSSRFFVPPQQSHSLLQPTPEEVVRVVLSQAVGRGGHGPSQKIIHSEG